MAEIEIEVSFGATKGLPNYSSERADQRMRMTISVAGETVEDQLNELVKYESIMHNHLVYAVAEALGMEAALSEGGIVSLVFPDPPPAQQLAPPQPPAQSQPGGQPQGGGGGRGSGPPKASREEYAALPRVHMDMGDGLKVYVDQRPLKVAGKYSGKAPDFKVDEREGAGYWIYDANGTLNYNVSTAMANAGVT
jgi:hypothetical protein